MRFDGIHHVTCITADAPRNVDFYTRVLGLRLVKKTVNQDDPTVYHLFYADEEGNAGSDITFFEYPNARPGQAGDGMVHTVVWRVGSAEALEFWAERLSAEGHEVEADGESLRFENPEGLGHELVVAQVPDEPLVAHHPEIPREVALQGFEGVRGYGRPVDEFLTKLGFEQEEDGRWDTRAETRGGWIEYAEAPYVAGVGGAGTVHHVAWASTMEDHQAWHDLVQEAGGDPTQIIDRFWFRSIYFREPAGVLFEIATLGPGFAADEDPARLGEKLILPPAFEHLRDRVEPVLTPLPDPRAGWGAEGDPAVFRPGGGGGGGGGRAPPPRRRFQPSTGPRASYFLLPRFRERGRVDDFEVGACEPAERVEGVIRPVPVRRARDVPGGAVVGEDHPVALQRS
jgi:glyoxalase family protein